MNFTIAITGVQDMRLPQWGRAFWQDPADGTLFLAYASGKTEINFITSADSGNTWSDPVFLATTDDNYAYPNFDTVMDRDGHIHCGLRYNGSGCYQFLGKSGSTWDAASGIGAAGLVDAGDSGNYAIGFNGSIVVQNGPNKDDEMAISFPAAKIAVKDLQNSIRVFGVGTPYNTHPIEDSVTGGYVDGSGGLPFIFTHRDGGGSTTTSVVAYDWVNKRMQRWQRSFGSYFQWQTVTPSENFPEFDVPYSPSMAIGSGIGDQDGGGMALACSSGGQSLYYYSNVLSSYRDAKAYTVFDTDLNWRARTGALNGAATGILLANSGIVPTGYIYGVGPNTFSPSGVNVHNFSGAGTNCDFSFNDDSEILFYFQKKDGVGKQSIGRFKGTYDTSTRKWFYETMDHATSGVKHVAQVSKTTTGGFSNMLFWSSFKALRHPVEPDPDASIPKMEMVATQGYVPVYPSGGIITIWDVSNSPAVSQNVQQPEFTIEYTATSGDPVREIFKSAVLDGPVFSTHPGILPNMFDGDNTTFGRVRTGYGLTLEFDEIREFSRIEILNRNGTLSTPRATVSGSMDNVNWERVAIIESGELAGLDSPFNNGNNLLKYSAAPQTTTVLANARSLQPINVLDPFCAKYIRMYWETSSSPTTSKNIYALNFYGPATTAPEIITWSDFTSDPPNLFRTEFNSNKGFKTENFRHQQGTLPAGWRTYGDFQWAVVGSGDFTITESGPPTQALPDDYNGQVPSGIFSLINPARGFNDGFSLRSEAIGSASGLANPLRPVPAGGIQPGHSGVAEIDVTLLQERMPRTIGFRFRADTFPGDRIEFYTVAPTDPASGVLRKTYYTRDWGESIYFFNPDGTPQDAGPEEFEINGVGTHTLRWIYHRDSNEATDVFGTPFGAAWIDEVTGLDATPYNFIRGFVKVGTSNDFSQIHGYMLAKGGDSIHGYLDADPLDSQIHGYVLGGLRIDESSQVHGYVFGGTHSSVHGFLLAGTGLSTIPTGAIHGYVSVPDGSNPSTRKGYVEGDWGLSIHGYVGGFGTYGASGVPGFGATGDQSIHGFVYAIDALSSIHGIVNAQGQAFSSSIHGLVSSSGGDQFIHGYVLAPLGNIDSRHGYLIGDDGLNSFGAPQSKIWGFVDKNNLASGSIHGFVYANYPNSNIYGYLGSEALVESGGGLVGGGPGGGGTSTSNVVPGNNWIHGYVKGHDGFQFIHGYVFATPGAFNERKGYVLAGATDDRIYGYAQGNTLATGLIHGYTSGVGFGSSEIHGWLFGSSGDISMQTHGYLTGHDTANAQIPGYLIGIQQASNSSEACVSHSFPLVDVPIVVIPDPSTFFNN